MWSVLTGNITLPGHLVGNVVSINWPTSLSQYTFSGTNFRPSRSRSPNQLYFFNSPLCSTELTIRFSLSYGVHGASSIFLWTNKQYTMGYLVDIMFTVYSFQNISCYPFSAWPTSELRYILNSPCFIEGFNTLPMD